jgi:acyl-CoA synthetase (AMP-forming)/AMP-acid ligase II
MHPIFTGPGICYFRENEVFECRMHVITEIGDDSDLERLDRAWSAPETFAFVPEKSSAPAGWIESALDLVPPALRTEHYALLTSGSTGKPKLVIGNRRRSERLAAVIDDAQDCGSVAETILALPLHYCYAFVNQWLWARSLRRRLVPTRGFSRPDTLRDALRGSQRAMICLVGVQVPLLQHYFAGEEFPAVLRVNFAGGRFPQEQLDTVRAFFPEAKIFNNFGCAEAMPRLTIRAAEVADQASDVGQPLAGIELRANDSRELMFRSPYGAVGFVDDQGFTSIEADTWVKTGDLGGPSDRGTWQITGRAGEVFKRQGEKVSLQMLQATVLDRWQAQAAFYRERDRNGEEGHVLVLAPQPSQEQVRSILSGFRAHHPRAWWPLRIEGIDALPLLASGKIDVLALPATANRTVYWQQRI